MNKSAYETSPCKGDTSVKRIIGQLEALRITQGFGDQLRTLNHPRTEEPIPVYELLPGPFDVAPFAHPIFVEGSSGSKYIAIDVRNFVRRAQDGSPVVSSHLDYTTIRNRAILECVANQEGLGALLTTGGLHVTVFIRWISDAIGRRLALPPDVQVRLTVLTGLFYLAQYQDVDLSNEAHRIKLATMVSRATFISVEDVLKELADVEYTPANVVMFVDLLKHHGGSARFENLSVALLYSVLYAGSWFGSNKNELIAVAVEHPPTFLAFCVSAAQERGYKDTSIGKLLKTYDKNDAVKSFLYNVWHLPVTWF